METNIPGPDQLTRFALDNNLPASIPANILLEIQSGAEHGKIHWGRRQISGKGYRIANLPSSLQMRVFQEMSDNPSTYLDFFTRIEPVGKQPPLIAMERTEFKSAGEVVEPIYHQARMFDLDGSMLAETISEVIRSTEANPNPLLITRYMQMFPHDNALSGVAYGTIYYASNLHFVSGANGDVISYLHPASNLIVSQRSAETFVTGTHGAALMKELTNSGYNYLRALFGNPYHSRFDGNVKQQISLAQSIDQLFRATAKFPEPLQSKGHLRNWSQDDSSIYFSHSRFGTLAMPRQLLVNTDEYGLGFRQNFSLS